MAMSLLLTLQYSWWLSRVLLGTRYHIDKLEMLMRLLDNGSIEDLDKTIKQVKLDYKQKQNAASTQNLQIKPFNLRKANSFSEDQ